MAGHEEMVFLKLLEVAAGYGKMLARKKHFFLTLDALILSANASVGFLTGLWYVVRGSTDYQECLSQCGH